MADDANKLLASISIDPVPTASIELAIVLSEEFGCDIALRRPSTRLHGMGASERRYAGIYERRAALYRGRRSRAVRTNQSPGNRRIRPRSGWLQVTNERIPTLPESTGLQDIGFCGFGFCLIERAVFDALPQPWFPQHWHPESRTHTTEDVAFFLNARTAGFIPMIDHDASKHIVHVGSYRYRWDECLEINSD